MRAAALEAVTVRLRDAVRQAGGNEAVSMRSGVPLRTLSSYLRGHEIKLSKLFDLAMACNVSPVWLVTGSGANAEQAPISALSEQAQAPLKPPLINAHWLAKAIEIVDALGGGHLPLRERAARIAHSYELLIAPEHDLEPLPQLPRKAP